MQLNHAQVRSELSEKYLQDKTQYLGYLKNAMADFKRRQEKAYSQVHWQ